MSKEFKWIGKPTVRYDGVARVTGQAQYADDLRLPGMLVGRILRSPHAHARIRSIDTSKAEALPGVKAVATGLDTPVTYGILPVSEDEYALAVDKVRFVGDEVAAVAAVDDETAVRALSLIEVDYEVLPAIFDPYDAMVREDVKIHEHTKVANIERQADLSFGDVEAGFAEADYIREDSFFKGAATHAPIEPHSALAHFRDGKLTVWTATQVPHYLQRYLAKVLGLPQDRVRVVKPILGGGFGGKGEPVPLEFAASILARKSGRPVKITYTREEVFLTHRGRHPMHMKLKTGVKKDGRITALHFESLLDGGAYGSYGIVTLYYSGQLLTGPYVIPAYSFKATRVNTNKPPCGAQRGHGAVQPRFAFEVHLDRIAADLGIDPLDMRLKNAIESGMRTVNELQITSCGFRECLERSAEKSSWRQKKGKTSKRPRHGDRREHLHLRRGASHLFQPHAPLQRAHRGGPKRESHRLLRGFGHRPGLGHHACAGGCRNHRRSPGIGKGRVGRYRHHPGRSWLLLEPRNIHGRKRLPRGGPRGAKPDPFRCGGRARGIGRTILKFSAIGWWRSRPTRRRTISFAEAVRLAEARGGNGVRGGRLYSAKTCRQVQGRRRGAKPCVFFQRLCRRGRGGYGDWRGQGAPAWRPLTTWDGLLIPRPPKGRCRGPRSWGLPRRSLRETNF